jgi:hypothetical protein
MLSRLSLDLFVAQRMSRLTECRPVAIAPEFTGFPLWLEMFVFRRVFDNHVTHDLAPLAFAIIRRARDAVVAHDAGVALLQTFVGKEPRLLVAYFDCLGRFEAALTAVAFSFETMRQFYGSGHFETGDGSPNERMQALYNLLKHSNAMNLPVGHIHALWLENDGIHGAQLVNGATDHLVLTFDELAELIRWIADVADRLVKAAPLPKEPE